ncbi:putative HNH homing endonuclease [Bacillus phage BC01]|nr:putative HNH endonuclease [Bacillus phage PBC6]AXU41208.1 putative HNH homing endonuclease [Bacillus phage BC01]
MVEVWKSLEGLVKNGENYSVSNLGRVRNDKRDQVKKLTQHKLGYMATGLGAKNTHFVHKLVALAFLHNDDPENKRIVNHKDGDKSNNRLDNLEWGTHADNIRHAVKQGLQVHVRGAEHHNTKFTEEDIVKIKKMLVQGVKGAEIARMYNVAPVTISFIKTGRSWAHVKVEGFTSKYNGNPYHHINASE